MTAICALHFPQDCSHLHSLRSGNPEGGEKAIRQERRITDIRIASGLYPYHTSMRGRCRKE